MQVSAQSTFERIPLSQGKYALVDEADYAQVAAYKWHLAGRNLNLYARSTAVGLMHRFLLNVSVGMEIDHINGNGLDNRRGNLRVVSRAQNAENRRKEVLRKTTSLYKGVSWDRRNGKWQAYITIDDKMKMLGRFDSETEAAEAYDIAAMEAWGIYARTNF